MGRDALSATEETLVRARKLRVEVVSADRLDQLSKQSKHQGMVLKCGARPIPMLHALPLVRKVVGSTPSVEAVTKDRLASLQPHDVKAALESWLAADDSDDCEGQNASSAEERWKSGTTVRDPLPVILALYRIQDPQNLGAILRSSFFFGVSQVVLSEPRSGVLSRITPAVSSASSGAAEHVNISQAVSLEQLLEEAKDSGYDVIGTTMSSSHPHYVPYHRLGERSRASILVLGNEHDGLPPNILSKCTVLTSIPSRCGPPSLKGHNLDSLNVGVAAGILLASLSASNHQ